MERIKVSVYQNYFILGWTFYSFFLGAGNRYRMQQLQQQDWCEQQIREKNMRKDLEKKTNELFDQ